MIYDPTKCSVLFNGQVLEGFTETVEIKSPKKLTFAMTIKDFGEIKGDLHMDEDSYNRYMEYLKTKDVEV